MDLLIGQHLGKYRISRLLKNGGMGIIYLANYKNEPVVAVKVMHDQFAQQEVFRQRFLQEAQTLAQLKHPNIVKTYAYGWDEQPGALYIAMEFISGDDLQARLSDLQKQGIQMAISEASQIFRQICGAVGALHQKGMVHRDIKPANVMLGKLASDGPPYTPKLIDLGLAKLPVSGQRTLHGAVLGTVPYMSPEQASGHEVDARSDVYSLGVMLYQMTVGHLPFDADTLAQLQETRDNKSLVAPQSLRQEISDELNHAILTALKTNPEERFANADEFAKALVKSPLPTMADTPQPVVGSDAGRLPASPDPSSQTADIHMSSGEELRPANLDELDKAPTDQSHDQLRIQMSDGSLRSVPMTAAEVSIGRGGDNDVVLDQANVSWRHALVRFDGVQYWVTDQGSSGHTFLNKIELLPYREYEWTPGQLLRIGGCYLRLHTVEKTPEPPPPPPPPVNWVGLVLSATKLSIQPGSSASVSVTVSNQGPAPDQFIISVEGVPSNWVSGMPTERIGLLAIGPNIDSEYTRKTETLTFGPPHSCESRAGKYTVVIRVVSQVAPEQVAQDNISLDVEPFYEFTSELRPAIIKKGRAKVTISNLGNTPDTFSLKLQDQSDELVFNPSQPTVTISAGESRDVAFRAKTRAPGGLKRPQETHILTVGVSTPRETQTHNPQVVIPARDLSWILQLPGLFFRVARPLALLSGLVLVGYLASLLYGSLLAPHRPILCSAVKHYTILALPSCEPVPDPNCPLSFVSQLIAGMPARSTDDPPVPITINSKPALHTGTDQSIQVGEAITVLEGPICGDPPEQLLWWRVRNAHGIEGWVPESTPWPRKSNGDLCQPDSDTCKITYYIEPNWP